MARSDLRPAVLHTSVLTRAIQTANIALDEAGLLWLPVRRSWRLNERHYGALQGKNKKQTLAEFGEEQFMLWRRSYATPPPPIEPGSEFSQDRDPRYVAVGAQGVYYEVDRRTEQVLHGDAHKRRPVTFTFDLRLDESPAKGWTVVAADVR